MKPIDVIQLALGNLAVNKLRTSLTMLGVVIGVASIITMVSIVEGGKRKIIEAIERLGANLVFISPKELTDEEQRASLGRSKGLVYEDAVTLKAEVSSLRAVAPIVRVSGPLKAGGRDYAGSVQGTLPSYQAVRNWYTSQGRFLIEEDVQTWRRVAVLGTETANTLWPGMDPIGQDVKIAAERFTVVGVMAPKGSLHGINFDKMVFIPITTALRRFKGGHEISSILAQVRNRSEMKTSVEAIRGVLRQRHDGVEDFDIHSQEDFLKAVDQTIWTFRVLLGSIAAVSLVVGGIGIMNIMLVTVTERTGEIGVRKAVGARRRDILVQFLIEATTISLLGGLAGIGIGVMLGLGVGKAVANALPGGGDWGAAISPLAIILAFGFSVAVGVVFGLYPARRAASLDPAEALRYQ